MDELKPYLHAGASFVFHDEFLFCIDKPVSVLSHPSSPKDQVQSIFNLPYNLENETYTLPNRVLYLLHRLDKETSGCLLFALNKKIANVIKEDFRFHRVQKEYMALVKGIQKNKTTWKDHLVKKEGKVFVQKGLEANAMTEVFCEHYRQDEGLTLLKLRPQTGRTHQLRVQSSSRNLPIIGDRLYGNFDANKWAKSELGISRMCLHAKSLEFKHPKTQQRVTMIAKGDPFIETTQSVHHSPSTK